MSPNVLSAVVIITVLVMAVVAWKIGPLSQPALPRPRVPTGTSRKCHELNANGDCPECERMGLGKQHVDPRETERTLMRHLAMAGYRPTGHNESPNPPPRKP